MKQVVFALVGIGERRPLGVIGSALVLLVACWTYASKLEVRSDVMELLPRDSPGFIAFERAPARGTR
jgi:hypothetical protein